MLQRAVLRYIPESVGWSSIAVLFAAAAIAVALGYFTRK